MYRAFPGVVVIVGFGPSLCLAETLRHRKCQTDDARLVRVVKVFRLKMMKDLRLMVKGLIAGIRTLTLAFTLLFAVVYAH